MKIIKNKIIPFGGFKAINLFGFLFTKSNNLSEIDINHEMIHTAQMKEMLYIFYYIWYFIEWLIRTLFYEKDDVYKIISFEVEAYKYQDDLNYLEWRRKHYNWIKFL